VLRAAADVGGVRGIRRDRRDAAKLHQFIEEALPVRTAVVVQIPTVARFPAHARERSAARWGREARLPFVV
jgi:hypothetical protein